MLLTSLIKNDIEKMEAMSFSEIEDFFRPMFAVIRPERKRELTGKDKTLKNKVTSATLSKKSKDRLSTLNDAQQEQLKNLGIDLNLMK